MAKKGTTTTATVASLIFLMGLLAFLFKDTLMKLLEIEHPLKPLFYILFEILEIVVIPIPGLPVILAVAGMESPIVAFLILYTGLSAGSICAYLLARWFGDKYLSSFLTEKQQEKTKKLVQKYDQWLILLYAFPIFPQDFINVICGFLRFPKRQVITAMLIGYISWTIIVIIAGQSLAALFTEYFIYFVLGTVLFFFLPVVLHLYNITRKKS